MKRQITFLFGITFILILWFAQVHSEDAVPTADTVPPLKNFQKSVIFNQPILRDNIITYTITMNNPKGSKYAADIQILDVLPSGLILTGDVLSSTGIITTSTTAITWSGHTKSSEAITISYQARILGDAPTGILTNTATLREINNDSGITPTTKILSDTAIITISDWQTHLPLVRRDPTPTPTLTPTPTNTPTLTPTPTSTPTPIWQQLTDPSFEVGTTNSPWVQRVNGNLGKVIYSISERNLEQTDGLFFAWLGGRPNETREISQTLMLLNAYQPKLRYRYWVASGEVNCNEDTAQILLNNTIIYSQQLCSSANTFNGVHGWREQSPIDITAYQGQSVTFVFKASLDSDLNSNWFIDKVELCSADPNAPTGVPRCN